MAIVGVGMALGSAALYDTGFVLEKQALSRLPPVPAGLPGLVRTVKSSPRWLTGFVAMLGGLGLQLLSFTRAPVPVVQPILAAGIVVLVLVSRWVLGERLGRRESAAASLVIVAVAAIAVSSAAGERVARSVPAGRFVSVVAPVLLLGGIAAWAGRGRWGQDHYRGLALLGGGAGLLYGVSAVAEKAVATQLVRHGLVSGALMSLSRGYLWLFLGAAVWGLAVFQVGLQRHLASLVVPLANVLAAGFALVGASVVFGEGLLPGGWWALPRLLGFVAVVGAVLVLCVRPAEGGPESHAVADLADHPAGQPSEAALWG